MRDKSHPARGSGCPPPPTPGSIYIYIYKKALKVGAPRGAGFAHLPATRAPLRPPARQPGPRAGRPPPPPGEGDRAQARFRARGPPRAPAAPRRPGRPPPFCRSAEEQPPLEMGAGSAPRPPGPARTEWPLRVFPACRRRREGERENMAPSPFVCVCVSVCARVSVRE